MYVEKHLPAGETFTIKVDGTELSVRVLNEGDGVSITIYDADGRMLNNVYQSEGDE